MWLHIPDWKVLPTIYFVDGYSCVLTCKYHYSGCNLIQIHCCRWITNIPPPVSDQFCRAVVKPRTVNHTKVGYNYTGYQMVEQRSSCKDPDTIHVSIAEKTDHSSILIQKSESGSYANRTYMKSLVKRIIDDETISNDHAEGIEEFSKKNQ